MAPCGLLRPLLSVCFEEKLKFSASQELDLARSRYFKLPQTASRGDAWSIRPPDFSLKLYRSSSLPQKKERKTHANPTGPQTIEAHRRRMFLPNVLRDRFQEEARPKFITSYRPPDALETDLMFVRAGKHPAGLYQNPKAHNFRPLDEDLPDIITTYARDPGNLNLKLKHLDTIRDFNSDFSSKETKTRMDTFKPAEPKWDKQLILPRLPRPPKSASYAVSRSPDSTVCHI